jgi:hypothetical protein
MAQHLLTNPRLPLASQGKKIFRKVFFISGALRSARLFAQRTAGQESLNCRLAGIGLDRAHRLTSSRQALATAVAVLLRFIRNLRFEI